MDRKDLLKLARAITGLVRKQGRPGGYLATVDLLTEVIAETGEPLCPPSLEPGTPLDSRDSRSVPPGLLTRMLTAIHQATGLHLDPILTLTAFASTCRIPEPTRWVDGPAGGLYVTSSWKAAEAAIARYTGATHGAASFTDWSRLRGPRTVGLQASRDHTRFYPHGSKVYREPTGISSPQLTHEPSGTVIAIGPLPLSQHEQFQTAEQLHEACFCASEYGHRVLAVIRTPQPTHLVPDLLRALGIADYFDLEFVRSVLRGTVHADGRLALETLIEYEGTPAAASNAPRPGSRGRPLSRALPRRARQTRRLRFTRAPDPSVAQRTGSPQPLADPATSLSSLTRHGRQIPFLADDHPPAVHTRAWQETVLALSAQVHVDTQLTRARQELTSFLPASQTRTDIPKELITLLAQGIARRDTGLLLLGGRPGSFERQLLLARALAATEAIGSAAIVLPAYRSHSVDQYLRFDESVGTESVSSRCFPNVPLFPSVEAACAAGHHRIVMEYECEPYRPLSYELVGEHAHDVCFLLCVDEMEAKGAFDWITTSDWDTFKTLIGIMSWIKLEGPGGPVALCDAFVPNTRPLYRTLSGGASEAVYAHRQLQWEVQAIQLLDSRRLLPEQFRHHLCAWGLLDAHDLDLMTQTARPEGLRIWLYEKLLGWLKPSTSSPAQTARYH